MVLLAKPLIMDLMIITVLKLLLANQTLSGTVSAEENDFISIELNPNNVVVIKKDFVTAVLPKGTLKSL